MKLGPTTIYILQAFIPYSKANMQLAFKPNAFFNELEKLSGTKERTLRSAYYRLIKSGHIEMNDGHPVLTRKGKLQIKIYKPRKLNKDVSLIVMFDIPEKERFKRDHLRTLLHELSFKQLQLSVWESKYDHREYLASEIKEYALEKYVLVYEAAKLPLK